MIGSHDEAAEPAWAGMPRRGAARWRRAGGRRAAFLLGGLTAMWSSVLAAQYAVEDAPFPRGGTNVVLETVAVESLRGILVSLSLDGEAVLQTDQRLRVPVPDIVRIVTDAPTTFRRLRDQRLSLSNGDVLYGRISSGTGDTLVVDTLDLGSVSVPLESVARLDMRKAFREEYRESVAWFEGAPPPLEDRILLTNGDILSGFVTRINGEEVALEAELGEVIVPQRSVLVIRFASDGVESPSPLRARLTLCSSGTVTVTELQWSDHVARGRLSWGPSISLETERIAQLEIVGGRWEWLAGIQPISAEHVPMLSQGWPYLADRNVLGEPISVTGRRWEHGIGVHSRSRLTYDLGARYREFVFFYGLDDSGGPYADVDVEVLVDGRSRYRQEHVRPGTLAGPIRIDLSSAHRLELFIDFGANGDIQDRFNWLRPALVRALPPSDVPIRNGD